MIFTKRNIIVPETIQLSGIDIKVVKEISLLACSIALAFKFESKNFNDILFYHNSPENLKNRLLKNDSRNLSYNLRNSENLIEPMAKTNSGEKTFGFFSQD
ncbi:hypothetical protein BpHYR1_030522 [Brachionus plicatilis]|uniref:Uncharacterized protein n=1 Tax=Brachionus plicatilis TaxID=10195 RepID=A0A3M7RGN7_BRAPC|nr:hypothetical protein BpHYR1_030522 [Brachionus plicatilis]